MEKAPEVYTVIEEPVRKNKKSSKKSRGRREAFTGSASNFRLFGALAMIFSVVVFIRNTTPVVLHSFKRAKKGL